MLNPIPISSVILFSLLTVMCQAHSQTHNNWPAKTKVLHIGGIFPINGTEGWQGGMVCKQPINYTLLNHLLLTAVSLNQ